MNDRKNDRPANVAPASQTAPRAIADELNRYVKTLVEQELPDKILALYQRFDELTKEKSEPETHIPQGSPASKEPPSK
jgi:hypothetical protein